MEKHRKSEMERDGAIESEMEREAGVLHPPAGGAASLPAA